jgi:transcription antitermination factor NusG
MFQSSWHVLHVTANHEKRVVQHLNARAVEHYLPLYTERSRWTDRFVQLERPLFAGYVFIRFHPQQRVSILSIPGVLHLLSGNGCNTVSCDELERIRLALANGYPLRPHPGLAVGMNVRVRGGVFDGVGGVIAELRRECKVVIALSDVHQSFSLEVGIEQLELTDMGQARFQPAFKCDLSLKAEG